MTDWQMRVCLKSKDLTLVVDVFPQTIYSEGFLMRKNEHTRNLETCCGMQWGVLCLQLGTG